MKRRFAGSVALGALASLVTLAVPAAAPAQEEEGEPGDRQERRVRAVQGGPGAVLMAGRAGGYLGIRTTEVDEERVERLGLPEERGALVVEVVDGTAAAEGGLQADDVIVSWNGERVESAAALSRLIRETPAGRTVRLAVIRDGSEREVTLELGEPAARFRSLEIRRAPQARLRARELRDRLRQEGGPARAFAFHPGRPRLGVSVTDMTEQLREYFGAEEGGALVTSVRPETPAARAGLRAGDVILSVAGERVGGPGDITRSLAGREEGPVEVRLLRDREERTVTVELEEPEPGARPGGAVFLAPTLDVAVPELRVAVPELRVAPVGLSPVPDVPAGRFHVAPPPSLSLPGIEPSCIEIEVDGLVEAWQEVDWDAHAGRWEEWTESWAERAEEWGERLRRWEGDWEDRLREWRGSWPLEGTEPSDRTLFL